MINADKLCRILAERQALHLQCYNVFGIVFVVSKLAGSNSWASIC